MFEVSPGLHRYVAQVCPSGPVGSTQGYEGCSRGLRGLTKEDTESGSGLLTVWMSSENQSQIFSVYGSSVWLFVDRVVFSHTYSYCHCHYPWIYPWIYAWIYESGGCVCVRQCCLLWGLDSKWRPSTPPSRLPNGPLVGLWVNRQLYKGSRSSYHRLYLRFKWTSLLFFQCQEYWDSNTLL